MKMDEIRASMFPPSYISGDLPGHDEDDDNYNFVSNSDLNSPSSVSSISSSFLPKQTDLPEGMILTKGVGMGVGMMGKRSQQQQQQHHQHQQHHRRKLLFSGGEGGGGINPRNNNSNNDSSMAHGHDHQNIRNERSLISTKFRKCVRLSYLNGSFLTTLVTTTFLLLSLCVGHTVSGGAAVDEPEFAEPIENITVPAGREVKLACSVKNLGPHKVAWIHFEGSAILTVQTHVITRNPRIKVTHDKHRTWYLHIEDVQETDAGRYMCQINTETAKTQFGYLHVVVPPNIDDSMSSSDVIVRENSNVSLSCHATGSPEPEVKWRREDSGEIRINKTYAVTEYYGETLDLSRISRLDMGAYMCIATNGVPPAVSKRIKVSVDFPPMLWIPHQLIGVPQGFTVTLECTTEAHPASLNYWTREDGHMIHENRKYRTTNDLGQPQYKTHMKLTIFDIQPKDFGTYKCVAKNPRGETEGQIKLYESAPPTTTTVPTTTTKMSYRRQKGKDQKDSSASNRNPSSLAIGFSEKGSEFSSNLNTVDKSQIRSTKSGSKTGSGGSGGLGIDGDSDWPEGNSPSCAGRQAFGGGSPSILIIGLVASSLLIMNPDMFLLSTTGSRITSSSSSIM